MATSPSEFPALGRANRARPRWLLPLGILALGLLLAAGLGYRYWISTPQYSLLQAKGAFEAHDLNTFEKYVAIDPCADSLTDDVFAEVLANSRAQSADDPNPFAEAGRKIAEGLMIALKPAIAGVLKTKSREYVSTGQLTSFASRSQGSTGPVDLDAIKNNITRAGLHFEGIRTLGIENDIATVEINFHNEKKNAEQPVQLEMRHLEGHWQVSRWKNATMWLKQFSPSGNP